MSETASQSGNPRHTWWQVDREGRQKRSATERVADFLEIYGPYDEETARIQAQRCVQCPEPSCVTGCPMSNRIPEWLALTAEGQFLDAAALLHTTSSLPEICARLCPADRRCEDLCILNGRAEPVSIGAIEQFLNEYAFAHGETAPPALPANGLRVAVIGSGPGGLTCADVLSRAGFAVTVFDWRSEPGGLLVSGTPAFRLERSVVRRRIEVLQRRGVEFRLGLDWGQGIILAGLRQEFDAIFLGFGARKPAEFAVPGRQLNGVQQGLSLLLQAEAGFAGDEARIELAGKRVVVVGGGDMAMNCLRTAIRRGAREATCVYRRDEDNMPCSRSEYRDAVEEGARFHFQVQPREVLGTADGKVRGLRLVRTEPAAGNSGGRRQFCEVPGTDFEIEADIVLLALGFEPVPLPADHVFGGLARNPDGTLRVDSHFMTSLDKVFAGGELVRGPSTVLDVVRDARQAARCIQHHLLAPSLADVASG